MPTGHANLKDMIVIRSLAATGLIAMSVAILYGFTVGDFSSDGALLLANPWGVVSLVDLYVGFILFSIWISYREKLLITKIIWIALMMVLGFWTASLYVLIASFQSESIEELLLGSKVK